ncbi:hypothetical protein, partial [Exiguobacterium sp. 8A]|uniref:hypothetical protein n=1 Tax=Exiguobacterium sp. 8A TaxID=2653139 RepID=UPI001F2D2097
GRLEKPREIRYDKGEFGAKNQIHQNRMVRASTRSVQPSVASSKSDLAATSPTEPYGLVGFFVFPECKTT